MTDKTIKLVKKLRNTYEDSYGKADSGFYCSLEGIISELEQELEQGDKAILDCKKEYIQLLERFRHVHSSNGVDDTCKECGFDLRNPIHSRTL